MSQFWRLAALALFGGSASMAFIGGAVGGDGAPGAGRPQPTGMELAVQGLHVLVSGTTDVELCERFIRDVLPSEGANFLVAEINYNYRYTSWPEVVPEQVLEEEDVRRLAAACRESGVNFVPQINCLGHQSWAGQKGALLEAFPQFDETPWIPDGDRSIFCRSYCPLHPDVHKVVFGLIDELADVSGASDFHVGMDEVFLIAEDRCPRCGERNPAELYGREANALRDHLAATGRTMWMWGDRLIDAETHFVGMHEASANHTHPAVDMLDKDIIICDWHYERVPATLEYFVEKGFRVVACPWRIEAVALHQLAAIHRLRRETDRALGVMQTTWCEFGDFVRAYHGEGENVWAAEAARCFKTLFAAMREGDKRLAVAEKAQQEPTEAPSLGLDLPGELIAQGRYRVVLGGSKAGSEDFQIARTDDGYHLRAQGIPPSGLEAPFEMILRMDRSFAACAGELHERVAVPLRARYHLAERKARAEATLGNLAIPPQRIEASEGALLVGPSYAGWAWVIRAADLRVGQSAQVPIVVFGLGSWQMIELACTLSREEDMPVTLGDGSQVASRHYRLRIATPMRELPGEVWTDNEGVVLRLKVVTSVGPVAVELESLAEAR